MTYRSRARGVALLIVLVVLVLIATLATEIAITARTTHRLADNSIDDLLLRSAVDGRIEILKAALRYDGTNGSGFDGEADEWSWHKREKLSDWGERGTPSFPTSGPDDTGMSAQYKTTDIELTAWCEDERSKINLRGLMKPEDSPVFQNTRDVLIRLIDLYREGNSSLDLSDGDGKEMVDDLVKWLQAEADTEENPMPAVKPNRGRLQIVDDLLRVPGGRWTADRLYDVKDPELDEDEETRQEAASQMSSSSSSSSSSSDSSTDDVAWERQNGVPGLFRYLTVFTEEVADPPMRINLNTAPLVVIKALLDPNDEDLAQKIVEHRRQGADDESDTSGTTSGTSSGENAQGFFKTKPDITKVEGMDQDLTKYPRLNFFADVGSSVFSLRVIARAVSSGNSGADSSSDETTSTDEEEERKEVQSVYDFRVVVQRTNAGFVTLFTERRNDPRFDN